MLFVVNVGTFTCERPDVVNVGGNRMFDVRRPKGCGKLKCGREKLCRLMEEKQN